MGAGESSNQGIHVQAGGGEGAGLRTVTCFSVPFPGAKRPLEEGQKLGWWDLWMVGIQPTIAFRPSDIYILGAWHPVYEQLLTIKNEQPGCKVGVLWTSSVGEMDLVPVERKYLRRLVEDNHIDFIWFGDKNLANLFPEKGFYAPYPLKIQGGGYEKPVKDKIITLFCPASPKKNILNQLVAIELVQRVHPEYTLHTNLEDYDLFRIKHERHGWLPQDEYYKLLASAKVNMACSVFETFNYQAAEAAMLGTPSVVSPTVPVYGRMVVNINDAEQIAKAVCELIESEGAADWARHGIANLALKNNAEAHQTLSQVFGPPTTAV